MAFQGLEKSELDFCAFSVFELSNKQRCIALRLKFSGIEMREEGALWVICIALGTENFVQF